MRYLRNRALWIGVFASSAWIFSGTVSAGGCIPNPDVESEIVTEYGGSALSCPTNYSGCTIEDVVNGASCTGIENPDGSISEIRITVDANAVFWESYTVVDSSGNSVNEKDTLEFVPDDQDADNLPNYAKGADAIFWENGTGGNGCFWSYGTDQVEGNSRFEKNNGTNMPAKAISFCSDGIKEFAASPPPPPAVVEECVIPSGQSKEIYGVTFSCPLVGPNEERTIIVVENTKCDDDGLNCIPVPGFGFLNEITSELDFNNVCKCVGPAIPGTIPDPFDVIDTECDPDPANVDGGCEIIDAEIPVEVLITNPTCFTVGGFRRCF